MASTPASACASLTRQLKAVLGIVSEVQASDKSGLKTFEASAACRAVVPYDDQPKSSLVRDSATLLSLVAQHWCL